MKGTTVKRLVPTLFTGLAMSLLATAGLDAAPINGPGQIVSATSTALFTSPFGGCTGPGAANCTIDGVISGAGGTFVEWDATGLPETFTYTLNQPYDITRFLLWNDRGVLDSGIGNFDLFFKDPGGSTVGTFNGTAVPFQGSNPLAEVFNVGLQSNVKTVEMRVNTTLNPAGTNTQLREIAFDGTPVPEPASAALIGLGSLMLMKRRYGHS